MPKTPIDTPTSGQSRPLPLAGVRVLDVSQVMAGPYCCMLLADLGADVIKIEPPGTGDQTRGAMGFKMKGSDSMGFLNMNRNKRSLTLNLKTEAGKKVFFELVKTADILVENYRPGVMKKLGIDYASLQTINPGLVYASISGFGQTGPWADRPPVKAGVPVADIGCALFAVYGILSAYIGKTKTGEGQFIDASLFDSALAFSIWDTAQYWGTGVEPYKLGTANHMSAPYQAMKASDGYFVMGATNQKLWKLLCDKIGHPELFEDARFKTNPLRLANRLELAAELEKMFTSKTCDEWVTSLLAAGIPAGPINTYPEAFDSEHGRHRKMRMEVNHPIEGTVPNIGFAVKMNGTPQQVYRHPPLLGEHTGELLAELGIAGDELKALESGGAFTP